MTVGLSLRGETATHHPDRVGGRWNDPITSSGSLRVLPKWFHSHGVRIAIGLIRIAIVLRVPIRPGAVI